MPAESDQNEEEDKEAINLWLARIAGAPEAWRTRALNAASLLGGAAALSLVLLTQASEFRSPVSRIAASAAGVGYVVAVVLLLVAAVHKSPRSGPKDQQPPPPGESSTPIVKLRAKSEAEAVPIRRLVRAATWPAAIAITATGIAILAEAWAPAEIERATVRFADASVRRELVRMCPNYRDGTVVSIRRDDNLVRLHLDRDACGDGPVHMSVLPDAIALTIAVDP